MSSSPIIATSSTKSRHTDAPATAIDDFDTPPPVKPQIKTTPNYVSVVQVGSATPERRVIPVTTMSTHCVNGGSVTLQSSPTTGRQHTNMLISDVASGTPIKSSLKKAPGHTKNKSVSFSTGSADDDDEESVTAMTRETSNIRQPDAHRPSLTEAIVNLDRDRVDGIVPRRSLVSDSGVFCEPNDDQTPFTTDDSKATTTQPSRRTTVIVSGGMAAVKNSPKHLQREQLADLAVTKPNSRTSSRTLNASSNSGSVRPQQVSTPRSSATVNVINNVTETQKPTTEDMTPDVRSRTSDTNEKLENNSNSTKTTLSKQRKRSQRSSTNKQCRTQ